jgi:outer membrane protein assembly complex protein YaeT
LAILSFCLLLSPLVQALGLFDIANDDQQKLRKEYPRLFQPGIEPSQAELDEAIRFLMKIGNYESVASEREAEGNQFAIRGRPLRSIEEVQINGEQSFPKAKLLEVMEIQIGEKFDRKKAVAAAEKVKQFYGESGYFNTIVNLTFLKGKNQNIVLKIDVQENQPCSVVRIDLKSENKTLSQRLTSHLSRFVGKPLTEGLLTDILKRSSHYLIDDRYLTTELVGPDIRYNDDKTAAYLSYEIKDPYRWEFFIQGNIFSSQMEILRALDWSNRDRKNVEPASEGAERIKRDYLSKGFPQIQVEFQIETDNEGYLKKVFYTINEGFRVKLARLEIQGRVSRPPRYYSDFIRSNSSDLIDRGYYNRQDLDLGFKNLTTELRNQGYLRARVQSSRIEYDSTKQNATVYVLMDEGPLTLVQAIDFDGNHFVSNYELTQVIDIMPNTPLILTKLEAGIEKLKDFYHNQGFLEMKILNEGEDLVHYNDSSTLGRLQFKIYEGPRVRVASVRIEGNTITHTDVIAREAKFKVGEILTPKDMDDATERLNKTGLFSKVDIHTLEENTSVSERTLIISVADRDPGVLRFGGGVSSERDFSVRQFTNLSYNNLGGTARAVSGRVELGENVAHVHYLESDISAGYLEPFVFDSLTRGRINVSRSEHVFDYSTDLNFTKITLANVITFNLERDFNRHWRGTWRVWQYEERKDFEINGHCLTGDTTQFCPPDQLYVNTLGPTLDIDYRDNVFNPSRGSFTTITAEYADPILGSSSGIQFLRTEVRDSLYTRLKKDSSRWVWANHQRVGYLTNLSRETGSGAPVSHAFFLGGIDTVRGFDYSQDNERIPPGDAVPIIEGNQILVTSDSWYYLLKTEFRFPIVGEHGGVLFYDGGAVYISGYDFSRHYRDSVGVGYRYNTPVGPVALDIAFKINPRNDPVLGIYEAPFKVHFSIGSF